MCMIRDLRGLEQSTETASEVSYMNYAAGGLLLTAILGFLALA